MFLVLEEVDRMLDFVYELQIMKLVTNIRPDRQTVMTSATWPEGVRRLATKYLNERNLLYLGPLDLRTADTVRQQLEIQPEDLKNAALMNYAEKETTENNIPLKELNSTQIGSNDSVDISSAKYGLKNAVQQIYEINEIQPIEYDLVSMDGPAHKPNFTYSLSFS